ncbi:MAG: hypothetical protein U5Q16_01550 [Gammaproteobacteria bacterium]|nr:hypothetical protein [Gammaproteobacteria bacterium]
MLLMVFMAAALLKSLRDERRQWELRDALLHAELESLLEAHRQSAADPGSGAEQDK